MTEDYREALPKGHRLADFTIVDVLEQDAVGFYYKAADDSLGTYVVLQEFLPGALAGRAPDGARAAPRGPHAAERALFPAACRRFLDDARAMAAIQHPNLVRITRYFEANDTAYTVRPFFEGVDLMAHLIGRGRRLDEGEVVRLIRAIGQALEVIHAHGRIHHQVEPARILIRPDAPPMLLHFGTTWQQGEGSGLSTAAFVSPGFAAVEQQADPEAFGPWTDLYGLAGSAYWAITGTVPAAATRRNLAVLQGQPDPLIPLGSLGLGGFSPALLGALDWGLRLSPRERPQGVAAFLDAATGGETGGAAARARPVPPVFQKSAPSALAEPPRRDPALAAAVRRGFGAGLLVGGGAVAALGAIARVAGWW